MTARLLDGAPVAEAILSRVAFATARLAERGIQPGLGTILVGDDGPSAGYVRKKHEACERLGFQSIHVHLPAAASQAELLAAVDQLNADPRVHSYLIQHPVPNGLDFNAALARMDPSKDADGLHPFNLGRLVLQDPGPIPCTPGGIQAMLSHYEISIAGREVVVVGRGPTLGRPLALLLSMKNSHADAAVTVVHSGIGHPQELTRRADILIAAVGSPRLIQPDWIKPGAVVISGGISWHGKTLVPDVDESVAAVASWITPRLGGVGPTTVAMLMLNTQNAAEKRVIGAA